MNRTEFSRDDLESILSGDTSQISALTRQGQHRVSELASGLPLQSRTLTAAAIKRVLSAYSKGDVSKEEAQAWASFMLRGYVSESDKPVTPIQIEFEREREEDIVEVLARLDDLGERVDGIISQTELREFIERLSC